MNIIQYQYPFDPNGVLPSNLITNENHNITASAGLPYNFIIPRKAPYFADSLVVTHPASGRTLDVGVDYVHSYLFQQQSNTEPFLMVYGGISLLTTEYDGAVLTLQYQTLGGEYVLPEADILAILANAHIDPRMTSWDSVALRPGEYHPEAHLHHVSTTMGWDDLVLAVRDLIEKIRVESSELAALFQAHIDDKTNPHETDLIKLGIERFANVYKATLSQANLGTNDINYITPFLLRDVLNNTDLITADRVGLGLVENFPPATSTEILLGTIGRYVTSDLLKEFYARRNGEGATGLWDISILGNSATTSRLQTTRRINGTDFNGTANITTETWGTARNITVGDTTKSVNGSANVSWSRAEMGVPRMTSSVSVGVENTESCVAHIANPLMGSPNGGLYSHVHSDAWKHQIQGDYRTGQIALRGKNNGTWQGWRFVLDSGNFNAYSPTLTGAGASGNWGINITGNAATATKAIGTTGQLTMRDIRTISPSAITAGHAQFGFTTWGNNNTTPYADFILMRGYGDASGGADNLVVFNKSTIGMRIYQQTFGSTSAFATYKDVAFTDGTNATGTWNISTTGNAATATALQTPRLINRKPFSGTANLDVSEWFHSGRDFTLGTLVTTNINYAVANGEPWCLEITGNPFLSDNSESFETTAYGYIYNGTITSIGGQHNGTVMPGIIALNVGGNLCFWWPRYAYWQGFNVRVYAASEENHNRVVSITNSADPGGTKRVTISDKLQDKPIRRGQSSAFVIPDSGKSAGVTWTGLTDHHHIYAERYASPESTRLVIESTDNPEDYTVFRHSLPSGASPVDTFEIRREVVRSNVFFEHVGMNRISDGTLKLNQSEVNYDDFDIDQLSLMNWTWSDDEQVPAELRGKPGQGVIAQEVMKVFPDCVRESDEGILRVDDAMLATKLSIILLKKLKKLGL